MTSDRTPRQEKSLPIRWNANLAAYLLTRRWCWKDTWAEHEEGSMGGSDQCRKTRQNQPTYIELTYRNGDITAIDGKELSPATVLAGVEPHWWRKNGIGRPGHRPKRAFVSAMKSRGCYETPRRYHHAFKATARNRVHYPGAREVGAT